MNEMYSPTRHVKCFPNINFFKGGHKSFETPPLKGWLISWPLNGETEHSQVIWFHLKAASTRFLHWGGFRIEPVCVYIKILGPRVLRSPLLLFIHTLKSALPIILRPRLTTCQYSQPEAHSRNVHRDQSPQGDQTRSYLLSTPECWSDGWTRSFTRWEAQDPNHFLTFK